ncbi:MAG: secretin and TonB N-terminal domain-containing protein [Syntrophorhabdaceae bacterium]
MKKQWIPLIFLCFFLSCVSPQTREAGMQTKPPDIPNPVSFQVDREQKPVSRQADELYSFSLREADVKDILRAIAKQTDYNVVIEPDVRGLTTVDLKNVTLPKALEYILDPLNFQYKIEDKTVYVSRPKLETKVFYLNYIALRKRGASTVTWKTGGGQTTTGTGGTGSTTQDKAIEIINETDSDIWKNLDDSMKNFVSPDGRYVVNRQAFFVMVTDYPRQLKRVSALFEAMEGVIHRQIMIEAKIVEVILNDASREGVNWQFINARIGSFARISGQQALPGTLSIGSPNQLFRFFVGSPSGNGDLNIENTFIDLLRTQGEVRTISNPKIQTLNNQRAVIKDTTQLVYFDSQQSTAAGGAPLATFTTQFVNIGIILDVIPQIDDKNNIVLNIHPAYSLLERYQSVPGLAGGQVPIISTRETDTVVRVKDGETVIIGGLIYERKEDKKTGIPGAMSVPLLGALFRITEDTLDRRELVVFLTPRIIYDQDK